MTDNETATPQHLHPESSLHPASTRRTQKRALLLAALLVGSATATTWSRAAQRAALAEVNAIDRAPALGTPIRMADLVAQRNQLSQAIDRLQAPARLPLPFFTLPALSERLQQLQAQLTQTDADLQALQNLELAEDAAMRAALLAQNPPHPVETWQKALSKWEEAVALLESVPSETQVYPQVLTRLNHYRQNVNDLSLRIQKERQAAADFMQAQALAQEATTLVKDPPHPAQVWQQAQSKWQAAIQYLEAIPSGTPVSEQAKTLLAGYQRNDAAIAQHLDREQRSDRLFNQGREILNEAVSSASYQNASNLSDFQAAIARLRQGIRLLRQVPQESSAYISAANYLEHYQNQETQFSETVQQFQDCLQRLGGPETGLNDAQSTCRAFATTRIDPFPGTTP